MNPVLNSRLQLTQAFTLIGVGLISFYTVAHGPGFDRFRVVDIVLLVATGMCFGWP